jgi:uncharacterized membrane protein YgcG
VITSEPPRALLITGTVGSGKTATADALGGLLADAGIPNAVVDLDWLRRSWPTPPGDPFNAAMTLRNLRDVARNYLEAGVSRLVLAGVVESRAERRRYEETLAAELTVCRLRVALPAVHRPAARGRRGRPALARRALGRARPDPGRRLGRGRRGRGGGSSRGGGGGRRGARRGRLALMPGAATVSAEPSG